MGKSVGMENKTILLCKSVRRVLTVEVVEVYSNKNMELT